MTYNFLICFDREYKNIAKVMLKSLYLNSGVENFVVHCFTRNISKKDIKEINCCNLNIIQYKMDYDFKYYDNILKHVSVSTMDRLLMTEVLDTNINKIVYLDIDLLVLNNIKKLFQLDTGIKGIAARSSIEKNVLNGWLRLHKDTSKTAAKYYNFDHSFNAGVLVVDLKKIRKNNFYEITRSYYTKAGFNDQIILNLYANKKYSPLDKKYNTFAGNETIDKDICILHFVGSNKPWKSKKNIHNHLWRKFV